MRGLGLAPWGNRERETLAITLEVLVERHGVGADQQAGAAEFEQLYATTYRALVSYCRRVVRSQADAEEIGRHGGSS